MSRLHYPAEKSPTELVETTHAGMTVDQFARTVAEWLTTARHPKFNRPYTELVYQPMLELLAYLRRNGFKTYIVSGGGAEFIRVFAEKAYGIPPEQVVGSSIKTKFELLDGNRRLCVCRKSILSTTGQASQWESRSSLAENQSWPSAIRMAICRCCSTPRGTLEHGSA